MRSRFRTYRLFDRLNLNSIIQMPLFPANNSATPDPVDESMIGKSGMGEVYQAHDNKVGREVAIKVLPAALSADADRLARFEREAKVLAQLNHSGIASIYSLEGRGFRGVPCTRAGRKQTVQAPVLSSNEC